MRDDALLAFERHATSKLSDVKDLLSIATLGFRGEALPSIASVSRLLLETRAREEAVGTAVEIAGGKILRCDEAALAGGTVITVRDLFFNVPARKKFLRSEQTEIAHIASLVTHYSLAHPDKSFLLRHNNSELLDVTPVATLRERVLSGVRQPDARRSARSGRSVARPSRCRPTTSREAPRRFRLRGFVSGPQVQKLNRNSIYLFVNGRLIRDRLLLHALSAAYHNLMPPACYPFALLFLDCDLEEVDVNVHPSKTEVRFRHGSLVHDFVRDTIRDVLMAQRPASSIPVATPPQPAAVLPYSEFSQRIENMTFPAVSAAAGRTRPRCPNSRCGVRLRPRRASISRMPAPPKAHREAGGSRYAWAAVPGRRICRSRKVSDALNDLRPLGQIHDSFIIAAGRDGLWIIDQHVAHERILFEQVLAAARPECGRDASAC